jgi:hypothetical protein
VSDGSFIGLDMELAPVAKDLGETRAVTLRGASGLGKARLALPAAAEELLRFRQGPGWWSCKGSATARQKPGRWRRCAAWRTRSD